MIKFYLIVFLLVCLALVSCRKNIEPDINIPVSGILYDDVRSEPVAAMKIIIWGCKFSNSYGGGYLVPDKQVNSFFTDANGRFNHVFKTVAGFKGFKICIDLNRADYHIDNHWFEIKAGSENRFDLRMYRFNYMKAAIQVHNNPYPPLKLNLSAYPGAFATVNGTNTDTSLLLSVLPGNTRLFYFTINHPDSPKVYMQRIDTLDFTTLVDTFYHSFDLYPSTFIRFE